MQCFPQINLQRSAIPFPFPVIFIIAAFVHLVTSGEIGTKKGQFSQILTSHLVRSTSFLEDLMRTNPQVLKGSISQSIHWLWWGTGKLTGGVQPPMAVAKGRATCQCHWALLYCVYHWHYMNLLRKCLLQVMSLQGKKLVDRDRLRQWLKSKSSSVVVFSLLSQNKVKSYFQGGLHFTPFNLHNPTCPLKSTYMPLGNKLKDIKQQAINAHN